MPEGVPCDFCLISTHALREEGDLYKPCICQILHHFYPRPPRGGRPTVAGPIVKLNDFYPRPPRGGRLAEGDEIPFTKIFLPTPSARRATPHPGAAAPWQ